MRIMGIHHDLLSLQGPTRLFLMMMEVFKHLGHEVVVVGRTKKKTTWMNPEIQGALQRSPKWLHRWEQAKTTKQKTDVILKFCRRKKLQGGIVSEELPGQAYKLKTLRHYHPIKHLEIPEDFILAELPLMYPYNYMPTGVLKAIPQMDLVFTDGEIYLPLDKYVHGNYLFYVHWPPSPFRDHPPLMPAAPAKVWCNSNYTAAEISRLWGPGWDPQVVYPPMWTDRYDGSPGFESRPFDIVMFSRLYGDKFLVLPELKRFKVAIIGSDYGLKIPKWVKVWKSVPFKTVIQVLSHSKVYVHSKGWGTLPSGAASSPEHFGITIAEAMACGCVPIVPDSGGPREIVGANQHGFRFKTVDDLRSLISNMLENRASWEDYHERALARAKDFDIENIAKKVSSLLR